SQVPSTSQVPLTSESPFVFDRNGRGADPKEWNGELEGVATGAGISLIFNYLKSPDGPRLHKHPYAETFIIQAGEVRLTAGGEEILARAGQVVVVPPGTPHKFVQSGTEPLEMLDIHASDRFVTEWLE